MPGRVQLLRPLGRGGMAELFEGVIAGESGFTRRVAVKRLLPEIAEDESLRASFLDEARILSQLSHPGVVAIYDFGSIDGLPYQALELIDGFDLAECCRAPGEAAHSAVPVEVALEITRELARTLDYVHSATDQDGEPLGIVHRDVKASNVLITRRADVKLADFGIAFAHRRLERTRVGFTRGTESTMSPEQSRGGAVDGRSDLFSLGCLCHWMIAGKSPIEDEAERLRVHSGGSVRLSAEIPRDVAALLLRALAINPNARPHSGEAFADACSELLVARGVHDARKPLRAWVAQRLAADAAAPKKNNIGAMFDVGLFAGIAQDAKPEIRKDTQIARFEDEEPEDTRPLPTAATEVTGLKEALAPTTLLPQSIPSRPKVRIEAARSRVVLVALAIAAGIAGAIVLEAGSGEAPRAADLQAAPAPVAKAPPPPAPPPPAPDEQPPAAPAAIEPAIEGPTTPAPPEPEPSSRASRERPPRPVTRRPASRAGEGMPDEARLARTLAVRDLIESDLAHDDSGRAALGAFRSALAARDAARAVAALDEIARATERPAVRAAGLRRRLATVSKRLKDPSIPAAEVEAFERRYFELRGALASDLDAETCRTLEANVGALEADLSRR